MLRTASQLLLNVTSRVSGIASVRNLSHYPIDDEMFGLNAEQIAVSKKITYDNDKKFKVDQVMEIFF